MTTCSSCSATLSAAGECPFCGATFELEQLRQAGEKLGNLLRLTQWLGGSLLFVLLLACTALCGNVRLVLFMAACFLAAASSLATLLRVLRF